MPLSPGPRWLAVTVPILLASVTLLAVTIRSLVRAVRGAAVTSFPVAEETAFTLAEGGDYDISAEGRLGTRDFAGIEFELSDGDGRNVPLQTVLMRTSSTSLSGRTKLQLRSFSSGSGGRYTLRVRGTSAGASPDNRIVIGRAASGAIVVRIVGVVLFGVLTIGSLVASILMVVLPRRS
jgi:hypothetical protein